MAKGSAAERAEGARSRPRHALALQERLSIRRPPPWASDQARVYPPSMARALRLIIMLSAGFAVFIAVIVGGKWLTSRFYEPDFTELGLATFVVALPVLIGAPIFWLAWPATCIDGPLVSTKRRFLQWRPPVDLRALTAVDYVRLRQGPNSMIVLYQADDDGRRFRWGINTFDAEQLRALKAAGPLRSVTVNLSVAEATLAYQLAAEVADADCIVSQRGRALVDAFGAVPHPTAGAQVPPPAAERRSNALF